MSGRDDHDEDEREDILANFMFGMLLKEGNSSLSMLTGIVHQNMVLLPIGR